MYACLLSAPTGDLAHNPGMCPDWESNLRPFGLQAALNPLSRTSQVLRCVFPRPRQSARQVLAAYTVVCVASRGRCWTEDWGPSMNQ